MRKINICLICLFAARIAAAQLPSLTLDDAIRLALMNNFGIRIATNDATIARNNVTKGNAGFLPNVNLIATETPQVGFTDQKLSSGTEISKPSFTNTINAGVQMQWVLYDGNRMFLELDRLKELQSIGELTIKIRSEQTISDVMRAFYNIIRQQDLSRGIQEQLDFYEERLRIAQTRLDVGKGNLLDVLQAQSDLSVQKTQLLRQQQQINVAKLQLKQLITEGVDFVFDVRDSFDLTRQLDFNQLKTNALSQNLNIELLKRQNGVATLTMKEIEAARRPRVTFNPSFLLNRSDNTAGLFVINQNAGLNAGVSLSYPLYDGNNLRRQVENAKIDIESSKLRQQQFQFDLVAYIDIAYQNYLNALEILRGEEDNMNLARQSINLGMERFRLSRSTILELKQIQQAYDSAVVRAVSAKYEAKSAEIELLRLSGSLIQRAKN